MRISNRVAVVALCVGMVALVFAVAQATVRVTTGATSLNTRAVNSDVDTTFSPAWCLNQDGEYRTNKVLATAVIPNYDSIAGATGVGLQDTARLRLQYKHKAGSWKWLTATAASDTALGVPPCSLSVQSTAALLIYADSIRLAIIRFDSAGTAGGGSNDSAQSTVTYWIDNVTSYLLYQEKQGN